MTEYQEFIWTEQIAHTVEILMSQTGKKGVAATHPNGVAVFYGADDDSDDKVITPHEFNQRIKITVAIIA